MNAPLPQQLTTTLADALVKVDNVVESLKKHGIKVSSNSSVGSLFAKVRQLNKQNAEASGAYDPMKFFASMEALWIAEALEMAVGEPKAREAIRRIVGSEMNLSGREPSRGKDALWELDVFRRLRLGGANPRFDEPDVVVSLNDGLGDYGIACKKVYLESGVAGALEEGCSQLKRAGLPGVVAFNLDEFMEEKAMLHAPTRTALVSEVTQRTQKFIFRHAAEFQRMIDRNSCDGVLLSVSVVYEIPEVSPPIGLARIPFQFSHRSTPNQAATARLAALQRYIDEAPKQ